MSILAYDSTCGTGTEKYGNVSATEDGEYVALRAAIPAIPRVPPSDFSDHFNLPQMLYTTQLLLLNIKHNWRHVPRCFKTSGHVKSGHCRYKFPREYLEIAESAQDAVILAKRNIESECINNFKPVLLHVVR